MSNFTSRPKHLNTVPGTNRTAAALPHRVLGNRVLCFFFPHYPSAAFGFSTGWRDSSSRPSHFLVRRGSIFFWFPPGEIEHSNKTAKLVVKLIGLEDTQKKKRRKLLIYNISLSDISWRGLSSVFTASSRQWVEFFFLQL